MAAVVGGRFPARNVAMPVETVVRVDGHANGGVAVDGAAVIVAVDGEAVIIVAGVAPAVVVVQAGRRTRPSDIRIHEGVAGAQQKSRCGQ